MIYTLKGGFVYSNDKIIKTNVIIENNLIKELGEKEEGEIINVEGLYLAPAFMDPHVHMREPGFTDSETIKTGSMAAARGGYTQVFLMPNTKPVISSKKDLDNIKKIIEKDSVIECLPLASITVDEKGEELVNFDELDTVGFSDDGKPVSNSWLMYQAMLKAKELNNALKNKEEIEKMMSEMGFENFSDEMYNEIMRK